MLRKLRARLDVIAPRSCHAVDAPGGGGHRRNRAVPASVGVLWLLGGIAPEAGLPWIGKIGSFQISSLTNFTRIMGLFAVLVASKLAVVL